MCNGRLFLFSPQASASANEGDPVGATGGGAKLVGVVCGCGFNREGRGGEEAIERKW